LRYTYRVDNASPDIQFTSPTSLTLNVSDIFTSSTKLHLTGTAKDESGIKDLRLVVLRPDSLSFTDPITFTQPSADSGLSTWEYNSTRLLSMAGTYQWWLEANDNLGNLQRLGPSTIIVREEQ
jgi:hypothetical protein